MVSCDPPRNGRPCDLFNLDLSRRATFIEPFLIACATRNSKFAGSGIVCLQRLVISKGLPKSRLQDALAAFNACTDLGLDVQLKILQALPSLLQNYAVDLEGDLLSSALQVCSTLQAVKASTVSGVAAATLQQLVSTVFEKVAAEDSRPSSSGTQLTEVAGDNGPVQVRPAAYDAYRLLRDLALAAEERPTKFVTFMALSPDVSLELIWSSIDANAELFPSHPELTAIIGANVFPTVLRALSERLSFAVTVRSIRILNLLLDGFLLRLPGECEVALGLCVQALDPESTPEWKRALVMEVLRDFFDDTSHVVDAYTAFDARSGGKPIVQDIMSTFVRLSTEKPAAIGLGNQSTVPTGPSQKDSGLEPLAIDTASGVVGAISSAFGVTEVNISGISAQWSLPRTPCMEQLDKSESAPVPETYIYALVLECLNGLSDCLARIVLPLTVHHEKARSKHANGAAHSHDSKHTSLKRSASFRAHAVPLNPLAATDAPYAPRVKAVAALVDNCWPAVLATSSSFLNAALDDQYFRNLIKAYQRFAQVAGLLRLVTPRDALMTTLAKASVPPHVLNAAISEPVRTPGAESPSSRVFSNPMSLLSVDSLVSQTSTLSSDRDRRPSAEPVKPMLMVRNLLCLRALLNLAIALGPTLDSAFAIVVGALRHTDLILSNTTPQQMNRQGTHKGSDAPAVVQAFSNEVAAVEAAASRLLESTADYPNDAFMNVLTTFCGLLHSRPGGDDTLSPTLSPASPSTPKGGKSTRKFSGLPGLSAFVDLQAQDYHFVIPKLGNLAELNVSRFTSENDSAANGWNRLIDELLAIARANAAPRDARRSATAVLVKVVEETIADVSREETEDRGVVQRRGLVVLLRLVDDIAVEQQQHPGGARTPADLDVQNRVLDSLRAVLERSGESLVAGWNRIIAIIIGGAFEHDGRLAQGDGEDEVTIDWSQITDELVSPQIGRTAFAATQLVCSDFLDAIPVKVMPSLIELLHRFMCQTDDLNTALTTITMAWNVSDFLFTTSKREEVDAFIEEAKEFDDVEDEIVPFLGRSKPAQWMFLLVCLRNVTARPLKEVRNAVFQTVCNVFKSHGDDLSPPAWDVLLRNTLLHIARTDSYLHYQEEEESSGKSVRTPPDIDMSKVIVTGISDVIAQHLNLIEQIARLPSLWEIFLSMLERYLDIGHHNLNAAVYFALAKVLAGVDPTAAIWKGPIYRTVHLWLKRVPGHDEEEDEKKTPSNQEAFLAYAEAGEEIYRLTRDSMSMSQVRTMIDNLYRCISDSDGPRHGADTSLMSPLQSKTLALLRSIRMDQPGIPACLVTVAAKLACLHHDAAGNATGPIGRNGPTFVAVASEAIAWLQEVMRAHLATTDDAEPPDFDALLDAVQSLSRLVTSKYAFPLEHKAVPLWRRATATLLHLAGPLLDRADSSNPAVEPGVKAELWRAYATAVAGIVNANALSGAADPARVAADETFDISSFRALRPVLLPRLGRREVPGNVRQIFIQALFTASIVHPGQSGDIPEFSTGKDSANIRAVLLKDRRGRVKPTAPTVREEMAYVCLRELIALALGGSADAGDNDAAPSAESKVSAQAKDPSVESLNLTEAAVPYLILRLGLPIRAYIADQPLRGRRPQPLSELEELLFCFEAIRKMGPLLSRNGVPSGQSLNAMLRTACLQDLYPLLVKAVATAGDPWSGSAEVLQPLQEVLASF